MSAKPCPFCKFVLPGLDRPLLAENADAVAFEDAFPSAGGHTLIVPRRHIERVLELTATEHTQMWDLARTQLTRLESMQPVDRTVGYTIGINDGQAAGQTVAHVHLHIIPRHAGDTPEPRGGLRWVIPATAKYWE